MQAFCCCTYVSRCRVAQGVDSCWRCATAGLTHAPGPGLLSRLLFCTTVHITLTFLRQAWLPKVVVVLGISLAIWTVLLFPLDVANRSSCKVTRSAEKAGHAEACGTDVLIAPALNLATVSKTIQHMSYSVPSPFSIHLPHQAGIATHCTLAIPTYGLWYACYIAIMVMVAVVIPFTMFYYEADSETCVLLYASYTSVSRANFAE